MDSERTLNILEAELIKPAYAFPSEIIPTVYIFLAMAIETEQTLLCF